MTNITQGKTNIITDAVKLNSQHSAVLAKYYNETIGLTLIEANENTYYTLGTPDKKVLLEIEQTTVERNEETTGLYHLALLLPTYEDLGTILRHLIVSQAALTGASNHGYSNAIYLNDPEGNGIEIYWDKDESEWDIQDDGTIVGITEAMDAEAALDAASPTFDGMPNGTTMGHVHLHIDDMDEAKDFYTDVMGLGLKLKYGPAAMFLASGNYHHHLGANVWKQGQLTHPAEGAPGMAYTQWTGSETDLDYIEKQLVAKDLPFDRANDSLTFKDPAGLKHIVFAK